MSFLDGMKNLFAVALCKLLLQRPDLLLLDEPTNHLDAESVQWLERFLAEYQGTCVAITHDRYFLDNVAQWILELDQVRSFSFSGLDLVYFPHFNQPGVFSSFQSTWCIFFISSAFLYLGEIRHDAGIAVFRLRSF